MSALLSRSLLTTVCPAIPHGKFLGDLGKATMRGVRKCAKCGTLNGTRGARCKNKACDAIFKSLITQKSGPEAVKIITGTNIEIYSVRLNSIGVEHRDFVQLPLVQDLEGNPAVVEQSIICSAAKCYAIDQCARAANDSLDPCQHIQAAVESQDTATPLSFRNSILNSMPISNELRQEIWNLATDTPGPLVQRISKNAMLVKTPVNNRHKVGFVHVIFNAHRKSERKFQCECSRDVKGNKGDMQWKKCVHYFSCICAFASDDDLSKTFQHILKTEGLLEGAANEVADESITEDLNLTASKSDEPTMEIVVSTDDGLEVAELCSINDFSEQPPNKQFKPDNQDTVNTIVTFEVKQADKRSPLEISATFGFHQWLTSVIERIHNAMHYQLSGNPEPLVFYIPNSFWDCLLMRISGGSDKRRLPDQTQTFHRFGDSGSGALLMRFIWYLYSINQICRVFDTSDLSMQPRLIFTKNNDESFSLHRSSKVRVESMDDAFSRKQNTDKGKSKEYSTFIRLPAHRDPNPGIPFTIDWCPDVLPHSKLGEMRVKFQFAHAIDGVRQPTEEEVLSGYIAVQSP